MRLIDADILMYRISEVPIKERTYRKAMEIVGTQPIICEANRVWIPCSERLPKNDEYILLSFENFTVPLVGRYEVDETGGAFYVGDDEESCVSQGIFVNAWQPLPKRYEG